MFNAITGSPMTLRRLTASAMVAALGLLPVQRAQADAGDAILGVAVGAILGAAAAGGGKKKSRTTRSRPRISAEQREENRQVQAGLNELNCNAGNPDGIFGRKTREAIQCFQRRINEPITGKLTPVQKASIILYYDKAKNGQLANTANRASAERALPYGAQALFDALASRTEDQGTGTGNYGTINNYGVTPNTDTKPARDTLFTDGSGTINRRQEQASLGFDDSHLCAPQIANASTASNSLGFGNASQTGADEKTAFCDLSAHFRSMATNHSRENGLAMTSLATECRNLLAPTIEGATPNLASTPPESAVDLVAGANTQLLTLNDSIAQGLRTCTGVGYETGDTDIVEGAVLYAAAIGDYAGVELIGWHLLYGIGGQANASAAMQWLNYAANTLSQTPPQIALFGPDDRKALLLNAAQRLDPSPNGQSTSSSLFGQNVPKKYTHQQAVTYFNTATRSHKKLASASGGALGLSLDELLALCSEMEPPKEPTASAEIVLRACRHAAYAGQNADLMYTVDETLAAIGDASADEAMAMHDALYQ